MPSVGLRKGSGLELDTDVKSTTWMDFDDCQCFYCSSHHSESDPSDIVCHRHCRYTPPSTWVKTMFKTIQYIYSSYHSYVLAVDGAKKWGMLLISWWPRSWWRRRWLWRINESDTMPRNTENVHASSEKCNFLFKEVKFNSSTLLLAATYYLTALHLKLSALVWACSYKLE